MYEFSRVPLHFVYFCLLITKRKGNASRIPTVLAFHTVIHTNAHESYNFATLGYCQLFKKKKINAIHFWFPLFPWFSPALMFMPLFTERCSNLFVVWKLLNYHLLYVFLYIHAFIYLYLCIRNEFLLNIKSLVLLVVAFFRGLVFTFRHLLCLVYFIYFSCCCSVEKIKNAPLV